MASIVLSALNGWTNNAAGSLIDRSVELANQLLDNRRPTCEAFNQLEWSTQVQHKYAFRIFVSRLNHLIVDSFLLDLKIR